MTEGNWTENTSSVALQHKLYKANEPNQNAICRCISVAFHGPNKTYDLANWFISLPLLREHATAVHVWKPSKTKSKSVARRPVAD